jgi:hypothetical protein
MLICLQPSVRWAYYGRLIRGHSTPARPVDPTRNGCRLEITPNAVSADVSRQPRKPAAATRGALAVPPESRRPSLHGPLNSLNEPPIVSSGTRRASNAVPHPLSSWLRRSWVDGRGHRDRMIVACLSLQSDTRFGHQSNLFCEIVVLERRQSYKRGSLALIDPRRALACVSCAVESDCRYSSLEGAMTPLKKSVKQSDGEGKIKEAAHLCAKPRARLAF